MKYIKNTGRYAIAFKVKVGNVEQTITLDRRRIYKDTGNIATSGITALTDEQYKVLSELKEVKDLIEKGELSLTDKSDFETVDEKDKEIAKLKAKLAENDTSKVEAELKAKDDEIASLKAQLEAKAKKYSKKTEASSETEGF